MNIRWRRRVEWRDRPFEIRPEIDLRGTAQRDGCGEARNLCTVYVLLDMKDEIRKALPPLYEARALQMQVLQNMFWIINVFYMDNTVLFPQVWPFVLRMWVHSGSWVSIRYTVLKIYIYICIYAIFPLDSWGNILSFAIELTVFVAIQITFLRCIGFDLLYFAGLPRQSLFGTLFRILFLVCSLISSPSKHKAYTSTKKLPICRIFRLVLTAKWGVDVIVWRTF